MSTSIETFAYKASILLKLTGYDPSIINLSHLCEVSPLVFIKSYAIIYDDHSSISSYLSSVSNTAIQYFLDGMYDKTGLNQFKTLQPCDIVSREYSIIANIVEILYSALEIKNTRPKSKGVKNKRTASKQNHNLRRTVVISDATATDTVIANADPVCDASGNLSNADKFYDDNLEREVVAISSTADRKAVKRKKRVKKISTGKKTSIMKRNTADSKTYDTCSNIDLHGDNDTDSAPVLLYQGVNDTTNSSCNNCKRPSSVPIKTFTDLLLSRKHAVSAISTITCSARVSIPTDLIYINEIGNRQSAAKQVLSQSNYTSADSNQKEQALLHSISQKRIMRSVSQYVDKQKELRNPVEKTPIVKALYYEEYTNLLPSSMLITIEHCHHCNSHNTTLRHLEQDYTTMADSVIKIIARVVYESRAAIRFGVCKLAAEITNEKRDRLGAFEVQIAFKRPNTGYIDVENVHSKISTCRWPSKSVLEKRVISFISKNVINHYSIDASDIPWDEYPISRPDWICSSSDSNNNNSGSDGMSISKLQRRLSTTITKNREMNCHGVPNGQQIGLHIEWIFDYSQRTGSGVCQSCNAVSCCSSSCSSSSKGGSCSSDNSDSSCNSDNINSDSGSSDANGSCIGNDAAIAINAIIVDEIKDCTIQSSDRDVATIGGDTLLVTICDGSNVDTDPIINCAASPFTPEVDIAPFNADSCVSVATSAKIVEDNTLCDKINPAAVGIASNQSAETGEDVPTSLARGEEANTLGDLGTVTNTNHEVLEIQDNKIDRKFQRGSLLHDIFVDTVTSQEKSLRAGSISPTELPSIKFPSLRNMTFDKLIDDDDDGDGDSDCDDNDDINNSLDDMFD